MGINFWACKLGTPGQNVFVSAYYWFLQNLIELSLLRKTKKSFWKSVKKQKSYDILKSRVFRIFWNILVKFNTNLTKWLREQIQSLQNFYCKQNICILSIEFINFTYFLNIIIKGYNISPIFCRKKRGTIWQKIVWT